MAKGRDLGKEFVNDLKTDLCMGHFTSAEFEGDFHLHILAEKINCVLDFDAEIVRIDLGAELDLFDFRRVLVLLGFFVAFGLFVAELAEIHQAANGRVGIRRDLDQVHPIGSRHVQGVPETQHPQLLAIHPDDTDLPGTDLPIYPDERTGRRRRT